MTITINATRILEPDGIEYGSRDCDRAGFIDGRGSLEEKDFNELAKLNVESCWYWYTAIGGYEGMGQMVGKLTDGRLFIHDMSHCSCYGPVERIDTQPEFSSIADIRSKIGQERLLQMATILDLAEKDIAATFVNKTISKQ